MLTKNHDQLTAEVRAHIAADAVVQGTYWDGSKGCFIGCLAHSGGAMILQDRYGLPLPLVKICQSIFEGLPADDAKAFFAATPDAVGKDGKDLSRVHWHFLADELRALRNVSTKIQKVIDPVIDGMDLLASGGGWPDVAADVAHAAADAAFQDAARAAARAAAYAARAAAYAARAASDAADAASDASFAAARAAAYASYASFAAARAADASFTARRRQRDAILRLISEAE